MGLNYFSATVTSGILNELYIPQSMALTLKTFLPQVCIQRVRSCSSVRFIKSKYVCVFDKSALKFSHQQRLFRTSAVSRGQIVQFKLSDIGEGITEVTVKECPFLLGI